jgi:hypothetical protein
VLTIQTAFWGAVPLVPALELDWIRESLVLVVFFTNTINPGSSRTSRAADPAQLPNSGPERGGNKTEGGIVSSSCVGVTRKERKGLEFFSYWPSVDSLWLHTLQCPQQ